VRYPADDTWNRLTTDSWGQIIELIASDHQKKALKVALYFYPGLQWVESAGAR